MRHYRLAIFLSALLVVFPFFPTAAFAATFSSEISLGSTGSEVTALQTILIQSGYLKIPTPTGYYGTLTKVAVKLYQTAHAIKNTGYVGPLTLASLNAQTLTAGAPTVETLTTTTAQIKALIVQLEAELATVLAKTVPSHLTGDGSGRAISPTPTAPTISSVSAAPSVTTATITWTTSVAASSTVLYGTTTAYGSASSTPGSFVTSQSITLTGLTANTTYHYEVESSDSGNNLVTSGDLTFTTASAPDITAPIVAVTAPSGGATVGGSSVTLTASSTDNVAVAGVTFYVNGVKIGNEVTSGNTIFTTTWNSTATSSGSHSIVAVSRDSSNNFATSSVVNFTVDNTAPVQSAISSGSPTPTTATITWTTDENATSQINYGTTSGYGTSSSSPTLVLSHSITLIGLTASTLYHYQVQSADGLGNTGTSTDHTFTTASIADVTPPIVAVTVPTPGAIVSGASVSLTASSTDNVAVAGVTFYVNGVKVGNEVTSGNTIFSTTWDSTATSSGSHSVVAVSRDSSNNVATSTPISFTVSNAGPTISSISSNTPGQTTATITWTTGVNASSTVLYGTTTAYGSASSTPGSFVTSQSITLTGLTASTTYHYEVESSDSVGNLATSSDQTFSTAAATPPPGIALNWMNQIKGTFFAGGTSWNIGSSHASTTCGTISAGNLLVAAETVWTNGGGDPGTFSVPSGWSLAWTNFTGDQRTAVFDKVAVGGELCSSFTSSWSVSSTGRSWVLMDYAYTGTPPGTPIDATSSQAYDSTDGTMTAPSASPTNTNDLLLALFSDFGADAPYTLPGDLTYLTQTAPVNPQILIGYRTLSSAGPTGSETATMSSSFKNVINGLVALSP